MSAPGNRAEIHRIGVLTGGGDAPGLNAVIRAVVKAAVTCHCEVIGLEDSFDGLIEPNRWRRLTPKDVTGILRIGGTILGTTNRGNPFAYPIETTGGTRDYSSRGLEMYQQLALDALVVIGGDGTLAIAHEFAKRGMRLVGVPKTIDNDIVETTNTFGCSRSIASVAKLTAVSIVVVAEGATPVGGTVTVAKAAEGRVQERLGGAGGVIAARLEQLTGKESRSVVLGHLQRGGAPTSFDRILATRFGARAVELLLEGTFGHMVAFHPPDIVSVPIENIVGRTRNVPPGVDVLRTARAMGISLGD
jgi:ATP-dependent phosphofructokinase / diphosphate-dependent phosphofructokinase